MNKFDLFDLMYMQEKQAYLKLSSIHETTMYTLYNTPINNDILKKDQHESNKKRQCKYQITLQTIILTSNMDQQNHHQHQSFYKYVLYLFWGHVRFLWSVYTFIC